MREREGEGGDRKKEKLKEKKKRKSLNEQRSAVSRTARGAISEHIRELKVCKYCLIAEACFRSDARHPATRDCIDVATASNGRNGRVCAYCIPRASTLPPSRRSAMFFREMHRNYILFGRGQSFVPQTVSMSCRTKADGRKDRHTCVYTCMYVYAIRSVASRRVRQSRGEAVPPVLW